MKKDIRKKKLQFIIDNKGDCDGSCQECPLFCAFTRDDGSFHSCTQSAMFIAGLQDGKTVRWTFKKAAEKLLIDILIEEMLLGTSSNDEDSGRDS